MNGMNERSIKPLRLRSTPSEAEQIAIDSLAVNMVETRDQELQKMQKKNEEQFRQMRENFAVLAQTVESMKEMMVTFTLPDEKEKNKGQMIESDKPKLLASSSFQPCYAKVGSVDHHDRDKGELSDDDRREDEVHHHNEDEYEDNEVSSDEEEEEMKFEDELREVALLDDRHRFIKLMEGPYRSSELFEQLGGVFGLLCRHDAVNCITALLEGEAGPPLELSLNSEMGICPLHDAAERGRYSVSVVDLLLRYGAPTNLKSKQNGGLRGGLLPLNVAVENFRLLARNTKQLDDVIFYYAMEGKLIEMAALLMVARENVLAGFDGRMNLHQFIVDEDIAMRAYEWKLTACGRGPRGKWDSVFRDKREVMLSAVGLLEVFERAGDCIEAYAQSVRSEITEQEVVEDIMFLLQENGFNFTFEGKNIDWKGRDNDVCDRIQLKMRGLREKRGDFSGLITEFGKPSSMSGNFDVVKNPVTKISNKTMLPARTFVYAKTPLYRLHSHVFVHPHCSATYLAELQKKRTSKKSLADLLSANTFGRFALLIKRGLRCI